MTSGATRPGLVPFKNNEQVLGAMLSRLICNIVSEATSPRKHVGLAKVTCFRGGFALFLPLQIVRESMAPKTWSLFAKQTAKDQCSNLLNP